MTETLFAPKERPNLARPGRAWYGNGNLSSNGALEFSQAREGLGPNDPNPLCSEGASDFSQAREGLVLQWDS